MKLQYPNGWTVTTDTNVKTNVLELTGPDGTYFLSGHLRSANRRRIVSDEIADVRNTHTKDTTFTYIDGPVGDTKVGGEPAKDLPLHLMPQG